MSTIAQIQLRTDTAAAWTAANPTLLSGEMGIESDTRKIKVGTGSTAWNALPYFLAGVHVRGQASYTNTGTVSIVTQGTYVSTGLTATFDSTTAYGISLGTTDLFALKNTTGSTQLVKVSAGIDAHAGNNQIIGMRLAKNGVGIPETECRSFSSSNDVPLITNWLITMAANDEISIQVANHGGTTALTLKRGRIVLTGHDQ
jgi:hypothetical protein